MSRPVSRASRRRSLLGTTATLAAVLALATACGEDGDGEDGGDEPTAKAPVALSAEQVETATLSIDNLGAGWTQAPPDPEDDEPGPGCLADIDAATADLEESAEYETEYSYGELGLPSVGAGVTAYPDEAAIAAGFDRVEEEIEACDSVSWSEDGFTYSIVLTPDTDLPIDGVDDQNGFTASGTAVLPDGEQSPIHLHVTFLRIGPNVASVATTAVESTAGTHAEYAKIAAGRLVAVTAGDEPPATTAPAV